MSKLSFVIAACVTLLASSTGMAAFTVTVSPTANANVWDLGSFEMADTTVNKFDASGKLVTSDTETAPSTWETATAFTDTLEAGTYQVFLVDGYNGGSGNSSKPFSITFEGLTFAGLVASNGFNLETYFNVWGALNTEANQNNGLLSAIEAATSGPILTELLGTDSNRALDIIRGPNSQNPQAATNPDTAQVLLNGNQLTYSVNANEFGRDYSLVFAQVPGLAVAAVPEPTTFAIWGLCSMGVVVAARRRVRRLAV